MTDSSLASASIGEALLDVADRPTSPAGSGPMSAAAPLTGPERRASGVRRRSPEDIRPDDAGAGPVGRRSGTDESLEFVVSQQSALDGVLVTLPDPSTGWHHLMYVSTNLAAALGYEPEQLLGRAFVVLFGDDPPRDQLDLIEHRLAEGCQVEVSHVLRHRSGKPLAFHATHTSLPSFHPSSRYRLILLRDLTRRANEATLADQDQLLASLARGQDLGSLCHDVATRVQDRFQGAATCWVGVADTDDRLEAVITAGYDLDLVGRVMRLVMGAGDPSSPRSVLVGHLPADLAGPLQAGGVVALWAFPALDRAGRQRGVLVVAHTTDAMPARDDVRFLDQGATSIARGIERAAHEAGLAARALHDPLTRLPNRVLIIDRLEQAMARLDRDPTSLSVLLVDIDRFRSINETFGPDVGDRVLMEVAGRLLAGVRLGDTVGRISSDQFLMVCMASTGFDPAVVARRVIRSLQDPIRLGDGSEVRVTASVGVVQVDDPALSPSAVIANAESALALAVERGRGSFALYDKGRQRVGQARLAFEQALSAAISGGELVLHYQPVCEVRTGRMIGAEALVRWDRPGHGLVPPGEFIGVAEETGLIVPLGAWAIDEVARALAGWPRTSGLAPVISVNLSARQLSDGMLVDHVKAALARHDLVPSTLGFEVTESMRIDDLAAAAATLEELRDLGCRIAVDDFGIGYATLDYLRQFSMADILKIDRSFIAGLGQSREDTAIVNASLALASSLKMRAVAEGVEHFGQLHQLAEMGCHYAQGFAMSPPVPLATALELWRLRRLFQPSSGETIALGPVGGAAD